MTASEYVIGAAFLAVVLGSALAATAVLLRRRGAALAGAPRVVAWGLLTAFFVFVSHLVPGALEVLSRETVAACAVASLALVSLLRERRERAVPPPDPPPARPAPRVSRVLAAGAVGAVCVYVIAHVAGHFDEGTLQSDAATFHLPNIAEWIQGESFWRVDDFVYDRAAGDYPQTGDVFMLATILPWESDFLARLVGWPFVALLGFAVYAAGRELAVPAATAALVAAALVSVPAVVYIAPVGLADPQMVGLFAAGGYFLLRHWRTGDGLDLTLAGLGLGLSLGTRWYGVFAVGAVIAVWLVALAIARRRRRIASRDGDADRRRAPASPVAAVGLLALVLACGGFWLVRNWVISGNPVFPVRVAPFGVELFAAPGDPIRDLLGFSLADYLGRPGVYRDSILPQFLDYLAVVSIAACAAALTAGVVALRELRSGASELAPRVLALLACAGLIAVAYVFTPYTAAGPENDPTGGAVNTRYVVPALVAAAPAIGWLIARLAGRWRIAAEVVVALLVLEALVRAADQPGGEVSAPAVIAGAVLVAAAIAIAPRAPALARRVRASRPAMAAAIAGTALALAFGGAFVQSRFESERYVGLNETIDFVNARAPEGARVGLVGEGWVSYPMFGPRLGNEVEPIAERRAEMLRAYPDHSEFERAVLLGDFDLVLVTELDTLDPERPLRQERWLRRLPFVEVAEGQHPIAPGFSVRLYAPVGSPLAAEGAA